MRTTGLLRRPLGARTPVRGNGGLGPPDHRPTKSRDAGVTVLLNQKNAIVYGAGGAIGSAVARAFAAEGARVFLAGRTRKALETVAAKIRESGGAAPITSLWSRRVAADD